MIAATLECRRIAREESVAYFAQMKLPDVDLAKNLTTAQDNAQKLLTAFRPQATPGARKAADMASKQLALAAAEQNLKMLTAECDRLGGLVSVHKAANLDSSKIEVDLQKAEALRVQAYQDLLSTRSALLLAGGTLAA